MPPPELTPATDVAGVLVRIDAVVAWSRDNGSRLGYFAALYKRVTRAIGAGCASGAFADAARMQRFDAMFANRYFAALNGYFAPGAHPAASQSWRTAFDACTAGQPVILLHMLAGMNAHIALDLGAAVADVVRPEPLASIHGDFDAVNRILAAQVDTVLDEIDATSPVLAAMYDLCARFEIDTIAQALARFRDGAWAFASLLAAEPGPLHPPTMLARDLEVANVSRLMLAPPAPLQGVVNAIARQESADVAHNVAALDEIAGRASG